MAFKMIYQSHVKSYRFEKGVFQVVFRNGIEIKSIKEFDPEPLVGELDNISLPENGVAMDLGGHFGIVAIYLAKWIKGKSKVIVYEADPQNYAVLVKNIELNAIENIIAINKGVYDHEEELEFYSGGSYTSSFQNTDFVEQSQHEFKKIKVPVVPLDKEMKSWGIGRLDFIKIDIEGSEVKAILGAKELLTKYLPTLMIETHIVDGISTFPALKEELSTLGYTDIQMDTDERKNPILIVKK